MVLCLSKIFLKHRLINAALNLILKIVYHGYFMRVLISAPNLDENKNVSGVSEVVKNISKIDGIAFSHFLIGSPDGHNQLTGKIIRNLLAIFSLWRHFLLGKFDIYHSNTALNPPSILRDLIFTSIAKIMGVHVLLHLHGGKFISKESNGKKWHILIKMLCKKADLIITLSQQEKDHMHGMYGIDRNYMAVLSNCIDNPLSPTIQLTLKNKDTINFLFLGRISLEKGILEIIEAFKGLDPLGNFKFTICGEGPLRDHACSCLSKILGNKFKYQGVVKGKLKEDILSKTHYILLPSWYEGMPMTLLEALGKGAVPITTDVSVSINELIKHNCGIFVKPGDINSLKEVLSKAIHRKFDWNKRSIKARGLITGKYKCKQMRTELKKIYTDII